MAKLRIGFIGLGAIADRHFAAFSKLDNVEITALCTRSETNLKNHCKKWNVPVGYTDYHDLAADPNVDAVVISVPPVLHKDATMTALNNGKHVLCEKPPAMSAAEAEEMMQCAQKNNRLLMYGFMFRYSKKYEYGRDVILSGMLGKVKLIREETIRRCSLAEGWFRQKSLAGGGPMADIGSHCIDLARYMMGNQILPVKAYAKTFGPAENLQNLKDYNHGWPTFLSDAAKPCTYDVEEMATAIIDYSDGTELLLVLSNASHIKEDKKVIEFIGDKGGLTVDPEVEVHTVFDQRLYNMQPVIDCKQFDYQGAIDTECAHFADCVINGTECKSSAYDGYVMMKLLDALYESAATGEAVKISY